MAAALTAHHRRGDYTGHPRRCLSGDVLIPTSMEIQLEFRYPGWPDSLETVLKEANDLQMNLQRYTELRNKAAAEYVYAQRKCSPGHILRKI